MKKKLLTIVLSIGVLAALVWGYSAWIFPLPFAPRKITDITPQSVTHAVIFKEELEAEGILLSGEKAFDLIGKIRSCKVSGFALRPRRDQFMGGVSSGLYIRLYAGEALLEEYGTSVTAQRIVKFDYENDRVLAAELPDGFFENLQKLFHEESALSRE